MSAPRPIARAVDSSVIAAVAYSRRATLDLTFRHGARYRYFTVPAAVVEGLLAAPSKGTYFNRHIRAHFRFQRLA
jgi:lysyl-tRNA synthetase class 2